MPTVCVHHTDFEAAALSFLALPALLLMQFVAGG